MVVWQLTLANLKYRKNAAVSFGLIVLLAVMLLNIGLTLLFSLPDYFDRSNERLNAPHYTVLIPNNFYRAEYADFLRNDPRVLEAETEDIVMMDNAGYRIQNGKVLVLPHFFDAGRQRDILSLSIVGETADIPDGEGVYVPISMRLQGFEAGDPFTFEYKQHVYTYRIAGFFESTWYATMTSNLLSFYLDSSAYDALYREVGGGKILSARLRDPAQVDALEEDFKSVTGIQLDAPGFNTEATSVKIGTMRAAGTMLTNMLSAISAAFAVIVLVIALLVLRFRISNYIEDNMQNIGALEAIGYTSGQIRSALALECSLAGLAGGIAGIVFSYGLLSLLGALISGSLGVRWVGVFHPGFDCVSLASVLLTVCLSTALSTRKVCRLSPVSALRSGLNTHSFRRNIMPLDKKSSAPVSLGLACKAIAANPWQYAMIAVILCGVTFVSAFAVLTFSSFAVKPAAFVKLMGEEMCDVMVTQTPHADRERLRSLLLEREGVRKVCVYDNATVSLGNQLTAAVVAEDFSELESISVYEGRLPQYDNEIVITGRFSDLLGARPGQAVAVERSGVTAQYVVCGLSQTVSNFGLKCLMTTDGIRRLDPNYQPLLLNVYLDDSMDSARFIRSLEDEQLVAAPSRLEDGGLSRPDARGVAEEKLRDLLSMYGVDSAQFALMDGDTIILSGDTSAYLIDSMLDEKAMLESTVGMYTIFIGVMCGGILALAAVVGVLILHLVVHATIVRRKREFGIYRALGYTSRQIRVQIALAFLPVSLIGVSAGAAASGALTGPLLSALMYTMGIIRLQVAVNPGMLALLAAAILALVFGIAMLLSRPVKKISAYGLFCE